MAKDITFGTDARAKPAKGVNTLADAVTTTLGPSYVAPCRWRPPPLPTMVLLLLRRD